MMSDETAVAPAKVHPIDVALAALSEAAVEILLSDKPSRFAEAQRIMSVATHVQQLRPASRVADLLDEEDHAMAFGGLAAPVPPFHHQNMAMPGARRGGVRWNDTADLTTQLIMVLQQALEAQKPKTPDVESRLAVVKEMAALFELRLKLALVNEAVPQELTTRIDYLLKKTGAPPHEPEPSREHPLVPADPLRGHPPDGAGEEDGDSNGTSCRRVSGRRLRRSARSSRWTPPKAWEKSSSTDPSRRLKSTLVKAMKNGRKLLSAVVFKNGKVEEVHRSEEGARPYQTPAPPPDSPPKAAVTVAQPTMSCPVPEFERAEVRANRVLRAFLTPAQLEDFERTQQFLVEGVDSGHRYILTSRQAPKAVLDRVGGRSVFDVTRGHAVCVHDWTVPASEELLGLSLFLQMQGRERYVSVLAFEPLVGSFH